MGERTQIWSSGGGVQSSAIAALICQGRLRPDIGVIVDTEREMSTTWEYHENVIAPALAAVGFHLDRVLKSDYAKVDLKSMKKGGFLIPAYTETGKLPTFCSQEWKIRVMRRWATRRRGVTAADVWLGISTDEPRRLKQPVGKWQNRYPLFELRMSRGDCLALVSSMGWPTPPRSSCWMCPNHTQREWREQKEKNPDDWARAVAFEKEIQKEDDLYLSAPGVSLEDADLDDLQGDIFGGCDSGYCFT